MKTSHVAGLVLLAIIISIASVIGSQSAMFNEAQSPYVALMLICGGTYDSSNLHMAEFSTEGEAKAWADAELQGVWDLAYIYHGYEADGARSLAFASSKNPLCHPGTTTWTAIP